MVLQFDAHMYAAPDHIGPDAHLTDVQLVGLCLQFNAPRNAVPVALRLVGHAVRVLSYADVLDAVVHADGDVVLLAKLDVVGDVVAVGHRQRRLVAYLLAVHVDGCLDVRTLQEQRDALVLHGLGDIGRAVVPGSTDIVALGGEEEGKLHLTLVAVTLHVGVEVVRRVVERTRPLSLY